MGTLKKIGLGIGVLALYKGVQTVRNALGLKRDLVIKIDPKIRFTNQGIELVTGIRLINPTDDEVTITMPFVRVQESESEKIEPFGISSPNGREIVIKANSVTRFTITIKIPWLDLASSGAGLLEQASSTGKLTFYILPIFHVKLFGQKLRIAEAEKFSFPIPAAPLNFIRTLWKPSRNGK